MTPTPTVRNDLRGSNRVSAGDAIRVLVLPREAFRPLFYFEPSVEEEGKEHDDSIDSGVRFAGLRRWGNDVHDRVRHIEQQVPERFLHPITWLKSRLPSDERLLMALRRAGSVRLVHPTWMKADDVTQAWSTYLDLRLRRRVRWFAFYALVLVPSIMLTLIPGPNFLGFWVTYRLVAHGIAIYSVLRARRSKVAVERVPDEVLDGPILTGRNEANRLQEHFQMLGLKARLKRERIIARLRSRREKAARIVSGVKE